MADETAIADQRWARLAPKRFEELVFRLVGAEGMVNRRWFGRGGGDKGRDIVGTTRETPMRGLAFDRKWVVQCKRYQKFPGKSVLYDDWCAAHEHEPDFWLLVTSAEPTSAGLDYLGSLDGREGRRVVWWTRPELHELLEAYPRVAEEFLGGPPSAWMPSDSEAIEGEGDVTSPTRSHWVSGGFAWDDEECTLYFARDGGREMVFDGWPSSRPVLNAAGVVAIAHPEALDIPGDLWLVWPEKRRERLALDLRDRRHAPSSPLWVDDDTLLWIESFAYGTHLLGGDVRVYSTKTGHQGLVYEASFEFRPSSLHMTRSGDVIMAGVWYPDGNSGPPENAPPRTIGVKELRRRLARAGLVDGHEAGADGSGTHA